MGSVADKIAKKIISSGGSKVVDLASWREGRKMALGAYSVIRLSPLRG